MPRLRETLEDFRVEEIPLHLPAGEGPHLWIEVEKRDANTEAVARALARAAGVAPRDVGFAGRKDRRAVARQWFSVPGASAEEARQWRLPGVEVRAAVCHRGKLRPGDLRGNRFVLRVTEVARAARPQVERRLEETARHGLVNRFGAQRFGRRGDNPEHGAALLRGERTRLDRRAARFLVTALQSAVFNRVLDERAIGVDELRSGDLAWEHATGTVFTVTAERLEEAQPRALAFELSPSGPLFGDKMWRPKEATLIEEERALAALGLPSYDRLTVPRWLNLPGGRRPLRVPVEELAHSWQDDAVELRFTLPPGSYATVLVEQLFPGEAIEEGAAAPPAGSDEEAGGDA